MPQKALTLSLKVDECSPCSKVVQFIKNEKYAKFTRIVFDTVGRCSLKR
jgi:hypothetical protein